MVLKNLSDHKGEVISTLIQNPSLPFALGTSKKAGDLVYSHIFPFQFYPETKTESSSYIGIDVNIVRVRNKMWADTNILIWVITHNDKFRIDVPNRSCTRLDYICELVDEDLNGSHNFGYDKLTLQKTSTGAFSGTWQWKLLVYEGVNLNLNGCN